MISDAKKAPYSFYSEPGLHFKKCFVTLIFFATSVSIFSNLSLYSKTHSGAFQAVSLLANALLKLPKNEPLSSSTQGVKVLNHKAHQRSTETVHVAMFRGGHIKPICSRAANQAR